MNGITRVNTISAALTTIGDVNSVKQQYAIDFRGNVHDSTGRVINTNSQNADAANTEGLPS